MKKQTKTALVVVGGAGLLGLAAYLLLKPASSTSTTAAAIAPSARLYGDPTNPSSVAYACNAAWRLTALGHPTEAAHWLAICQAAGARVPQNASQQYT